jgi:predicted protein tyrosine phosphatase
MKCYTLHDPVQTLVYSHSNAATFLSLNAGVWDVICILNSDQPPDQNIKEDARTYLGLVFDDVDYQYNNYIAPSLIDVTRAIHFGIHKKRLLITCATGDTRSATLAYIMRCLMLTPAEALRTFNPQHHHLNQLIIEYGAHVLQTPDIIKCWQTWRIPFTIS